MYFLTTRFDIHSWYLSQPVSRAISLNQHARDSLLNNEITRVPLIGGWHHKPGGKGLMPVNARHKRKKKPIDVILFLFRSLFLSLFLGRMRSSITGDVSNILLFLYMIPRFPSRSRGTVSEIASVLLLHYAYAVCTAIISRFFQADGRD